MTRQAFWQSNATSGLGRKGQGRSKPLKRVTGPSVFRNSFWFGSMARRMPLT